MENRIKMIITDLDRSLLNNEREITDFTRKILAECIRKGILIVFATARPLRAVRMFYHSIIPNAIICHSGADVYINDQRLYQCGIDPVIVRDMYNKILNDYPKINFAYECNDELFTNFDPAIYWGKIPYRDIDFELLADRNIDKIIIGLEIIKEYHEIEKYLTKELHFEISEGLIGMIMNKRASK